MTTAEGAPDLVLVNELPHVPAERAERAELARDRLADELAEKATIAPAGTRWPDFTLPTEHKAYAITRFCGQTVFAGGADPHHARAELARELVRKAHL